MTRLRPQDYRRWRERRLGAMTEALEQSLVFQMAGDLDSLRVLDIGTGDGAYAIAAARTGARVVALDRDFEMLRAARWRAADANVNLLFVQADARQLPFADRTFDRVFAITALCFDAGPSVAVREMARVLAPGGRLILGELGAYSVWAFWRRLRAAFGAAFWRGAVFRSPAELRVLVSAAGLSAGPARGAIYYPPLTPLAHLMLPVDRLLSALTAIGAAFLVVAAERLPTE